MTSRRLLRTAGLWMFRNRETGRVTIAQWPNPPLWTWVVATLVRRLTPVSGWPDEALRLAATGGLLVWAAMEVWSGVNPWRRLLGLGGLVAVAASFAS
jgi:hypothetical protein